MPLSPREQIASATMVATHEVVTNLTRAKFAMETLVHEMRDLTCLLTREGRIIWGNTTAALWLEVDHDCLHETPLKPLFPDEEWLLFAERMKSMDTVNSAYQEFHSPAIIKGQVRDVLWTLRPFTAVSSRRGLLLLASARDVTDFLQLRTQRAKLEAELETAQIMQAAFFPPAHILSKNLEICSFYRPADQCSGDWWGHFDLGNDTDIVCIADVTGHGAASALVTAMTQAACMGYAKRHFESSESVSARKLLEEINEIVCLTFKGDFYMTFFVFVIEHAKGLIRASNAAHNFPMVLRANRPVGKNPESVIIQGSPIGHDLHTVFLEEEFPVNKGDRYVLYTDGFTECRNPALKMYGPGSLRRSVLRHATEPLEAFRDALVSDAINFYAGHPLADDLTLVTVDIRP